MVENPSPKCGSFEKKLVSHNANNIATTVCKQRKCEIETLIYLKYSNKTVTMLLKLLLKCQVHSEY